MRKKQLTSGAQRVGRMTLLVIGIFSVLHGVSPSVWATNEMIVVIAHGINPCPSPAPTPSGWLYNGTVPMPTPTPIGEQLNHTISILSNNSFNNELTQLDEESEEEGAQETIVHVYLNELTAEGLTPLEQAVKNGSLEEVHRLIGAYRARGQLSLELVRSLFQRLYGAGTGARTFARAAIVFSLLREVAFPTLPQGLDESWNAMMQEWNGLAQLPEGVERDALAGIRGFSENLCQRLLTFNRNLDAFIQACYSAEDKAKATQAARALKFFIEDSGSANRY